MKLQVVQAVRSWFLLFHSKKKHSAIYYSSSNFFEKYGFAETLTQLQNLLSVQHRPAYQVESSIFFQAIPFGATVREVVKKLGEPVHTMASSATVEGHSALIFRRKVGAIGVTSCVHFYEGRFFLAQEVVRYPTVMQADFCIVSAVKDLARVCLESLGASSVVRGACGASVSIDRSVYLRIDYITGDRLVWQKLTGQRQKEAGKSLFKSMEFWGSQLIKQRSEVPLGE